MAPEVCKNVDPGDQVCDEHKCSLTCLNGKSCLQTCSGSDCSLECRARGCTQNCSSEKCNVECKGLRCKQTCNSSICSLKCHAKTCEQTCSAGKCTLVCDGRRNQTCNQICNNPSSCIKKTIASSATSTMETATTKASSKHYHTFGLSFAGESPNEPLLLSLWSHSNPAGNVGCNMLYFS